MRSNVVAYTLERTFFLFAPMKGTLSHTNTKTMKHLKNHLILLTAALALAACNGSDNGGSDNGGASANANRNIVSGNLPAEITRTEFPKVKGGSSNVIIVHTTSAYGVNFCTEFDLDKKSQRWSCYAVYKTNNVSGWYRSNWNGTVWQGKTWYGDPFQLDPAIPETSQPSTSEFGSSGYQRGHIVASADRICNQDVNGQTFYMTNMQPMIGNFNGNIWANIEAKIRGFATSYVKTESDTMFVCKGGTIDNADQIIGYTTNHFIVPKYFFAAVLLKTTKGNKALGFYIEHKTWSDNTSLIPHIVNIAKLHELTGIDFFCNLPDSEEDKLFNRELDNNYLKQQWGVDQ